MIHPQWMEIGVNGDHGVYAIIVRRLEQDDVTTHQLVAGVHHVLGLQLSNRIVVIQMENGVNGDHGVLAMMGRRLEQENAMEDHLVLGLQLRQMTVLQGLILTQKGVCLVIIIITRGIAIGDGARMKGINIAAIFPLTMV